MVPKIHYCTKLLVVLDSYSLETHFETVGLTYTKSRLEGRASPTTAGKLHVCNHLDRILDNRQCVPTTKPWDLRL